MVASQNIGCLLSRHVTLGLTIFHRSNSNVKKTLNDEASVIKSAAGIFHLLNLYLA